MVIKGFYYWKSDSGNLTPTELDVMRSAGVTKLYVKFFEVKTDEDFGPIPYAKSLLSINGGGDYGQAQVIPTVFIKNEVFLNTSASDLDTLASNVAYLVNKYQNERFNSNQRSSEIQIDCDWTPRTKENYFTFLKSIKKRSGNTISCTLRLYPYKYRSTMGVPPADKVMLMCYNLTSPLDNHQNSIQNNNELEAYLKNGEPYPLHLDIALPLFSSILVYRNGEFSGMITTSQDIKEYTREVKPMWYEVQKDIELTDLLLRKGDHIKIEAVTAADTRRTISLLRKHVDLGDTTTVTFFHLDDKNINQKNEALQSFYADFAR
jgi:hypothetical protein